MCVSTKYPDPYHGGNFSCYLLLPVTPLQSLQILHFHFSNSLIIHEEKTKEVTTVKEVWICDPNCQKIWRNFLQQLSML